MVKVEKFYQMVEEEKMEMAYNPDTLKWYFEGGKLLEDLDGIIKGLECYKSKGVIEIFFTPD